MDIGKKADWVSPKWLSLNRCCAGSWKMYLLFSPSLSLTCYYLTPRSKLPTSFIITEGLSTFLQREIHDQSPLIKIVSHCCRYCTSWNPRSCRCTYTLSRAFLPTLCLRFGTASFVGGYFQVRRVGWYEVFHMCPTGPGEVFKREKDEEFP